ncbi:MAG: hypothetical protein K2H90_05710 [Oscillospiraceae bacterium]|nr:hypothetical protein [Oscillospiraceae bacterium]
MPVEISQKLMSERYGGDESQKDIHEANVRYLQACRKSALYAAEKLGWKTVACSLDGKPLTVEEINGKLLQLINEVL